MTDLCCMTFTANASQILVAGKQNTFFLIDVEKGSIVSQHPAQARYTLMKKNRHICAATDDGYVHILSLTDYSVLKTWKAHSNAINDMDARNDFLVTCGFSVREFGIPIVDPIANVYDLKNLRPLAPLPFHAGAAYVRLHPKLQTTGFVASQSGQIQVVDLMNPINIVLRQANVQFMLTLEVSSSGNVLAITDSNGLIYLWGSPSKLHFNNISKETKFADPPPQNLPHMDWNDTPLNTVGMPYYSDTLASAWPSHLVFDVGAPPQPNDPALLPFLQQGDVGHYAPHVNHRKLHRYQVEDTRSDQSPVVISAPKFLSEKAKESNGYDITGAMPDTAEALAAVALNSRPQTERERMLKYSKVEIKYSRFGVDDFDFQFYNKTSYSGLETHISNSFINSLLQLYRFTPLLRNVAIHHTASGCIEPNCLLCEFGFLFDMLEKAAGQNCQATNLLRAFGTSREAASHNLFEDAAMANHIVLSNTIQGVNRFFLNQMVTDFKAWTKRPDGIDEILATAAVEAIKCIYCGNESTKNGDLRVHDMLYPQADPKLAPRNPMFKFSSILKATLERETKNRGWCNKCRRYAQLAIKKAVHRLPLVLMLNTAITNPLMRTLWESPSWLPSEIGILVQNRSVFCFEGQELAQQLRNKNHGIVVYELVGFVAEIDTTDRQQPHLVSLINVDISSRQPTVSVQSKIFKNWHLFNDFLVSPVDSRDAMSFSRNWKLPCVLTYQVKSAHGDIDDSWKRNLNMTLLHEPFSQNGLSATSECETLSPGELPTTGTPIALDTEFVELEKAEIDVKADGSQETIRPAKSGLARVSVLRGSGPKEGKPFIDDYITIYDTIVDYKTQYSGIHPGDLDPRVSEHNLVALKVAYKKLWLLLNLGCVFVGHGLASDFRKANIRVPTDQTVDTQYLYFPAGRTRRFSLKYLAWAVFGEYIQEDTYTEGQIDGHDSIEDARMALRLWRRFQEYEDADVVEQMIEEIYRKGAKFNWKPPSRSGGLLAVEGIGTGSGNSAVPSGRNTPDFSPPSKSILSLSPAYRSNGSGSGSYTPGNGVTNQSPLR